MTAHEIEEYLAPMRHEFADPRSLILPALKFAQGESGWLPAEDMAAVAEATGFSQAYVESVATCCSFQVCWSQISSFLPCPIRQTCFSRPAY